MNLAESQLHWDLLGRANPFWAILTGNQKWELDQFLLSGELEIARVVRYVELLGMKMSRQRALDFGCGVGRLTQALCSYFFRVDGVDIAPSMVERARELNRFGDRCAYHVNSANDLRVFRDESFDFIYSNIVLQHIAPEDAKNYMREFVRVLAPDGVAVFQMPSSPTPPGHGALHSAAFRARIRPRCWRVALTAEATTTIHVSVRNASDFSWPSGRDNPDHPPVMLGNHWLDRAGNLICNDDGRATLPADLQPGQEITLPLQITAPSTPGAYTLEFDMVQEMISWFKLKGSRTARVRATVRPKIAPSTSTNGSSAVDVSSDAALAIHVIPKDEVVHEVEIAGGKVVDVAKDGCAAPEWRSYRYCVVKEPTAERPT